jgi:hypothetical protein
MAVELDVVETTGTPICVAAEDGHKLHDRVAGLLQNNEEVLLSFSSVRRMTTAFLNVAIGQLYNEFPEETVRRYLKVQDIDQQSLGLLRKVIDRAKDFYREQRSQH